MRKTVILIGICLLVLSVAACNRQKSESSGGDGIRTMRIAWVDDTLDQTRAVMLQAAQDRVAAINASRSDIRLELIYYDAQKNVDKQLSDVETSLLTKPDVFIFSCVDTSGSIPAVEKIHAAGIPIVDIRDMGQPNLVTTVFYGADEATYAAAMTDWLKKKLTADPGLVLNVGLIYGAAAQTQQFARCDLVKDLAKEMPDRVKVIAEKYGDWDTEKALNITEDWLQSLPMLNYICCANDIMALGASNALVAAKKKEQIMVTGVDVTDEGIALIQEDKQDGTVGARLQDYGQMVDCALGLVEGTYTEPTYTIKSVYVVDKNNVQSYLNGTIKPYFD
jgi:ABC-type sugar transport system substrate-binding protein